MLQCMITWYFRINHKQFLVFLVHCRRCLRLKSTTWLYIFSLEISMLKIVVWKCLFLACNYAKLRSILWKPLEMERERESTNQREELSAERWIQAKQNLFSIQGRVKISLWFTLTHFLTPSAAVRHLFCRVLCTCVFVCVSITVWGRMCI